MGSANAQARLITLAMAALLSACLQTPQPIPPGTGNDASVDGMEDMTTEVATDSPGLDATDDPVHDASPDPVSDPSADTDIGDIEEEVEDDAEDDVEEDVEEDVLDEAPDAT